MITDQALIIRVLNGERNSFAPLVSRYQNYVFSIAVQIVKNRDIAEEVSQDVFMKVYKSLASYDGKSKFSTWIYKIAYRTAIDHYRRIKHTSDLDLVAERVNNDEGRKGAENKDLRSNIEKALDLMKPDAAAVLRLYYLEEQSVQELCEILDLSLSNAKIKLFRARAALKKIMEQYFKNEINTFKYAD